ncbi:hypothetical protein AK36_5032 [Burkholderia vietnamiensis LMG 10929]|nr:hypothetical protein AK36_5032 [Burkholderia vietnamiensis LMG 10929]
MKRLPLRNQTHRAATYLCNWPRPNMNTRKYGTPSYSNGVSM